MHGGLHKKVRRVFYGNVIAKIRYYYDIQGVCGFSIAQNGKTKYYSYVKNIFGDVLMIEGSQGEPLLRYEYDRQGRCKVYGLEITGSWSQILSSTEQKIDEYNPFRWRSYYRDNDTGLYYIKGRYYDEVTGYFLDADDAEDIVDNAMEPGWLDRNEMATEGFAHVYANDDNIFTSSELSMDVTYDENENKSWWEIHWQEFVKWTAFTVAVVASVVLALHGYPGMLICCITAGLWAAICGAVVCGIVVGCTGGNWNDILDAAKKGAVDGFVNGFTAAAIAYGISAISRAIAANRARRAVCSRKGQCFIAGTLVLCMDEDGNECHKPIEEVKVGDMVWAYDEATGESGWKPVVRLFRNQTKEWYHIFVNGEEIVCTGGHPFYVAELDKFIPARELKIGSKLLLSSGICAIIEAIQIEELEKPETTYNFEVADFHTYYVTESNVLVHNDCVARARRKAVREAWKQEKELVEKTGQGTRKWSGKQRMELIKTGKVKGFEGHHINSVSGSLDLAGNPNNIRFVTRPEHFALHSYNWKTVTTGKLIDRMAMLNGFI